MTTVQYVSNFSRPPDRNNVYVTGNNMELVNFISYQTYWSFLDQWLMMDDVELILIYGVSKDKNELDRCIGLMITMFYNWFSFGVDFSHEKITDKFINSMINSSRPIRKQHRMEVKSPSHSQHKRYDALPFPITFHFWKEEINLSRSQKRNRY